MELDLFYGFHQVPLHEDSRHISTFQMHDRLHHFKVHYFGRSSASAIFHDRIDQHWRVFLAVYQYMITFFCTVNHQKNIQLIWNHIYNDMQKESKCIFAALSVSWFDFIFSKSGMSAVPRKISTIKKASPSLTMKEVKTLQACQFNAKFAFQSDEACAQITKPLRDLQKRMQSFNGEQHVKQHINRYWT